MSVWTEKEGQWPVVVRGTDDGAGLASVDGGRAAHDVRCYDVSAELEDEAAAETFYFSQLQSTLNLCVLLMSDAEAVYRLT